MLFEFCWLFEVTLVALVCVALESAHEADIELVVVCCSLED